MGLHFYLLIVKRLLLKVKRLILI
uniref:Uncharacterized protein n=1 Tax=Arundo donax TaxID=35708 RepID=A0A0A8YC60_ARUDO